MCCCASAKAGAAIKTSATGTAENTRMIAPSASPGGGPSSGARSSIQPRVGVLSSSVLLWERRPGEIYQRNSNLLRHFEDPVIPVKFAVYDALDARVGDHLEAGPAGAGGRIDVRPFDAHAVAGGLEDGVGLGMDGG